MEILGPSLVAGAAGLEEGRSSPTLTPLPDSQEVQRISPCSPSGVRNFRVRVRLLGRWWRVRGGAGLNMPLVQAPGDSDVDSLTLTTPHTGLSF